MSHRTTLSALAVIAAFASSAPARSDLGWFDLPVSEDRPHVSFAEVIAWSDACMQVKPEEWPQVESVYADYVRQWEGMGQDEDKLWNGLKVVLGTDRVACIEAFRASSDAVLRTRDSSSRHIEVRRQLIELASVRGAQAPDALRLTRDLASRLAGAVVERGPNDIDSVPPMSEVLGVRDAVVSLRPNIAAVLGEGRADEMLARIVQAYELSGTTALAFEFRTIIENATALPEEERKRLAEAYAAADLKIRSRLAYEKPRDARVEADEELYKQVESILGADRASLVRSLAGGYVDVREDLKASGPQPNVPLPDMMNSAADALLARFVAPADIVAVEGALGHAFWRPMSWHGVRPKETPRPLPMESSFLVAVAGAKGDDELAIIESLHADYARRFAISENELNNIMSKQERLAETTNLLIREDEHVLRELQAAFGADRIKPSTIALARFTRLERTLPFQRLADRFDTMDRIPWPIGSIGTAVFRDVRTSQPQLPESRIAAMRAILEESAEPLLEGRLAAWRDVCAASAAFDRVLEKFAGVSNVAQERLVAMQAARLDGLAASAAAARRSYVEAITLVERLLGESKQFEAQYIALALIDQDLGRTDAGRRLVGELARVTDAPSRDRALAALVPLTPSGVEVLRASSEAAMAAGNMDDGDLGRIEAGTAVLTVNKEARRRLDRTMRAQVAIAWRSLRESGVQAAAEAFHP
jgi:hypothetical protein